MLINYHSSVRSKKLIQSLISFQGCHLVGTVTPAPMGIQTMLLSSARSHRMKTCSLLLLSCTLRRQENKKSMLCRGFLHERRNEIFLCSSNTGNPLYAVRVLSFDVTPNVTGNPACKLLKSIGLVFSPLSECRSFPSIMSRKYSAEKLVLVLLFDEILQYMYMYQHLLSLLTEMTQLNPGADSRGKWAENFRQLLAAYASLK